MSSKWTTTSFIDIYTTFVAKQGMSNKKSLRRFRVIVEEGLTITMGTGVLYRFPYLCEFDGRRISETQVHINSFPSPTEVVHGNVVMAMEVHAIEDMYWVLQVHSKYGEALYRDESLTDYMCTIPRGLRMMVVSRTINAQCQYVYRVDVGRETYGYIGISQEESSSNGGSALSSPSTGRSSSSALIPMRGVLCGRVQNVDGLVVRKTKDMDSCIVGFLSHDSIVYVQAKDFSERHPSGEMNVYRYQLVDDRGWVNAFNQGRVYDPNILIMGHDQPNVQEHCMPIQTMRMSSGGCEEEKEEKETCVVCMQMGRDVLFLHDNGMGHRLCCRTCGDKIMASGRRCPVCRKEVIQTVQIY